MCKAIRHGKKSTTLTHPPIHMNWFWTPVIGFCLFPLLNTGFSTLSGDMFTALSERWYEETNKFCLRIGEMNITFDDVACLLYISIEGKIITHVE